MVEVTRPGVWLPIEDARLVVAAYARLRQHLGPLGIRPALVVEDLHRRIHAATQEASRGEARAFAALADGPHDQGHEDLDQIGTAAAARLLGCSSANVADLARRGTLPGRRISGRWVFDRTTVQLEAARRRRR